MTLVIKDKNSTMKTLTKTIIRAFLISGLIYAGLMAGFDYSKGKEFEILIFLFRFSIFGFFMSLAARYKHKRQFKNEQLDDNKS
jgi:hypothetical protein